MHRNAILLVLVMIPLFAMALDFHPEATAQLQKEHFWADVTFTGDESYSITSVRIWYNHSPDKIFAIMANMNAQVRNHKNYQHSKLLARNTFDNIISKSPDSMDSVLALIGDRTEPDFADRKASQKWSSQAFMSFNLPWPLDNRWFVQTFTVDETKASEGRYRLDYEVRLGNFKALKGYWELSPIPDKPGWTEYRAQYVSNPGIAIPKFVAKKAAIISIRKDFEENKVVLSQQK